MQQAFWYHYLHISLVILLQSLLPRYYSPSYPVTNRIMTVQPAITPYMSPVSTYQVLSLSLPSVEKSCHTRGFKYSIPQHLSATLYIFVVIMSMCAVTCIFSFCVGCTGAIDIKY